MSDEQTRRQKAVWLAIGRHTKTEFTPWKQNPVEWDDLDQATRKKAIDEAEAWIEYAEAGGLAVVDVNPDHRHTPERMGTTADVWAECLRVLVYGAEPGRGGLVNPDDVYRLLGNLRVGGDRLTELLKRSGEWLAAEYRAGKFQLDSMGENAGGDPRERMQTTLDEMQQALAASVALYNAATKAQNAMSRVAGVWVADDQDDEETAAE
jgi:hypothetical protein